MTGITSPKTQSQEKKKSKADRNDGPDVLSWKLDPKESFSDWTIEIMLDDKVEETYHVHRIALALGERKSQYFCCLFRQNFQENSTKTSRIKLDHGMQAKAFPQLLNYLYNLPVKLETDSATSVHSLSQYFEMEGLETGVETFFKKDIGMTNFKTYYHHAKLLQDKVILDKVLDFCWENLKEIGLDRALAKSIHPELWRDVFDKIGFILVESHSHAASLAVAHSLKGFEETIDKGLFEALTRKKFLPYIDKRAACSLMEMELKLCSTSENGECTFLQERCIYSLAKKWRTINHERIKNLSKENHMISVKLLELVSIAAQDNQVPAPIEKDSVFDFSVGKDKPLSRPDYGTSSFKPFVSNVDKPFCFGNIESFTPQASDEQKEDN